MIDLKSVKALLKAVGAPVPNDLTAMPDLESCGFVAGHPAAPKKAPASGRWLPGCRRARACARADGDGVVTDDLNASCTA